MLSENPPSRLCRQIQISPPSTAIIEQAIERLTQRTVKFIRWLKNHLELERDWNQAVARLTEVYSRS